jgi:NAD(P)-dependent dehydrogenase (short-subunit alcohol dehydrogenase family)
LDISNEQLEQTFMTNIYSMFYMVKVALPHLKKNARIINTASVTAYKGSAHLLDYSATEGAIVAFTRSLSQQLVGRGIYVNAERQVPYGLP